MLQVPTIPKEIQSESTLAVLFMILIGVAVVLYGLAKGPSIIGTWRAASSNGKEKERTDLILSHLVANTQAREREAAKIDELTMELRGLREGLHNRVNPAISGLSYAYLKLAGLPDMADRQEARERDSGMSPAKRPDG